MTVSIKSRANGRNIVGCYMLRPFGLPVACCCAKFEISQTFTYVHTDALTPTLTVQKGKENLNFVFTSSIHRT